MNVEERLREIAATHERCFWLDGGGGLEWSGRRSLIGWLDASDVSLVAEGDTVHRLTGEISQPVDGDIFTALERELENDGPDVHWVGFFGYDARPDLPARPHPITPTAIWMRATHVEVFDHPLAGPPRSTTPDPATVVTDPTYAKAFSAVQEELHAGNSYEVNLTYRQELGSDLDPVEAYVRLRELNPAPYAGYLQHGDPHHGDFRLLSSSPERFAAIDRHRRLQTKPIKGTTPRGTTPGEDAELKARLETDPKFRAENLMIVDLLRNDVAMVSEPGSVTVPSLMAVESYETVHQLVSTITGQLRDSVTTIGALRALFPAGSMTGAPKLRTMEIIDAVESTPRGVYAGAFGWISGDGRADLGVVIRSLVATREGEAWRYELGTGGGITVNSEVGEEYAESRWKADRLLEVFRTPPARSP
jgi:para-aminobenzoate synthetase